MKIIPIILLSFLLPNADGGWKGDFAKAQSQAKESKKYILLNFSGSDWCTPCIKMHKTIFQTEAFESFADKQLVLVNADFPRLNKNRLSKEQQKANDQLADKYDPAGKFPYTVLMDQNGKVIHSWEGCPNEQPEQFVGEINKLISGEK